MGLVLLASLPSFAKPKYGPFATPLSRAHDYFARAKAPDFWILAPYYTAQRDDRSCSLATMTMLVNALRAYENLDSETPLVTQKNLLEHTQSLPWARHVGPYGSGATLSEMAHLTEKTLRLYGWGHYRVEMQSVPFRPIDQDNFKKHLRRLLVENEENDRNFLIINFLQGQFTGDASIGHFAIIGAYDAKRHRVLILDPDREWYEPYWVSEETLFEGCNTQDPTSKLNRGYIWIHP